MRSGIAGPKASSRPTNICTLKTVRKPLCDRLLADTELSDSGCLVTATTKPRKVRFRGGQDRAYRFIFCVANHLAPTRHQVVRHRCHNRRCLNPAHLELGDRMENLLDERERQANGVDYSLL